MIEEQAPHLVRLQAVQFPPARKNPVAHPAQLAILAELLGQVEVGIS